jgi:hypothetical protein
MDYLTKESREAYDEAKDELDDMNISIEMLTDEIETDLAYIADVESRYSDLYKIQKSVSKKQALLESIEEDAANLKKRLML